MKSTVLVLFLLFACAAFAQTASVGVQPVQGATFQPYSHPEHASQHEMSTGQSLLGEGGVTSAHGERPLWEFGSDKVEPSLGDVARAYRKEKAASTVRPVIDLECINKIER
jgi:hypothetical protein